MSFAPTISNNGTKTITRLPVALQGHVVILTKHQNIQNVWDVVIFEGKAFASQNPGDWIYAIELQKKDEYSKNKYNYSEFKFTFKQISDIDDLISNLMPIIFANSCSRMIRVDHGTSRG